MEAHQQRVVDEKTDLDAKLQRLALFFSGPIFSTLKRDEQDRLHKQAHIMQSYSEVLAERIAAF